MASVRRRLIEDARRFSESGNHEQAVATFLQAARTAGGMNPSVRRAIAQEFRALERWRETFINARLCVREVDEVRGALQERARILADCRAMMTEAAQRVGRVVFVLPDAAPADTRVTVSEHVDRNRWTDGVAVSPGPVTLTVSAAGYRTQSRDVVVGLGQVSEERIDLAPEVPSAPPVTPPVVVSPRPVLVPSPAEPARGAGAGPWVMMASGALLGAGGILTAVLLRDDAVTDLRERQRTAALAGQNCGDMCDAARARNEANAQPLRERIDATNIALGASIGVVASAVVGGLVWYLVARTQAAPRRPTVAIGLDVRGAGISLGGTF